MPQIDFTRYYRNDEIEAALKAFAEEYPSLAALGSISARAGGPRDLGA